MTTITPSAHLSLGDRLARARREAKLSQFELAGELGISRVSVSHYENDRSEPSFETVCDWARATNVFLSYFADGTLDGKERPSIW